MELIGVNLSTDISVDGWISRGSGDRRGGARVLGGSDFKRGRQLPTCSPLFMHQQARVNRYFLFSIQSNKSQIFLFTSVNAKEFSITGPFKICKSIRLFHDDTKCRRVPSCCFC